MITSETKEDGKVNITWSYDTEAEDARHTHFVITVHKMHKAAVDENFKLAATDFDYIESTGTFEKPEERGMLWDPLQDCPGWWARKPMYMDKAMGIHVFYNFSGAGEDFGAAYIVSPDYDLTHVTDKKFNIRAKVAQESADVYGGFVVWAWNTNWWDPKNVGYKPVYDLQLLYDDLSFYNWREKSEEAWFPNPDDYTDPDQLDEIMGIDYSRTRVALYGRGYTTCWFDDMEVSVDLKAGDMINYGASEVWVDGAERSFSIDTTGDTENDYVYAYEVRALNQEYDDYRNNNYIRATNHPYKKTFHRIGDFAGVDNMTGSDEAEVSVMASGGIISVTGAQAMQIFNAAGACVYDGGTESQVNVGKGVFIVKAGSKTEKVIM